LLLRAVSKITFGALEDKIGSDNPVRFIDAFVEHIDLVKLGFIVNLLQSEGRPAFNSK
jgi:hypothetical protein